jgi:hypothetical protein
MSLTDIDKVSRVYGVPPVGQYNWLAASGFRFTTRKIEIFGTNTDVYKATAYIWL